MRYKKKFVGGRYLGLSHFLGIPVINPALWNGPFNKSRGYHTKFSTNLLNSH